MIIYNGQTEEKQKEELERRQRRQFSNVGLAASAFLILPIILQMLAALGLGLLLRLTGIEKPDFGPDFLLFLSSVTMYLIAFPLSAALMKRIPKCGAPSREIWGLGSFLLCLVLGAGLGFGGSLLGQLMAGLGADSANAEEMTRMMMETSLGMNVALTVLAGPVVEELFFRKLIMDRLLGFGQLTAILISAFMFALAHGNFSQFFYALALGLLWGYVYAKTGRIGYTIAFHMIFNFFGGVVVLELTKLMEAGLGNHWLVKLLGLFLETEPGLLEGVASAVGISFGACMMIAYGLTVLVCFGAVPILLFVFRKKIFFEPGRWPLKKGRRLRTAILNGGILLYVFLSIGLFFWNS